MAAAAGAASPVVLLQPWKRGSQHPTVAPRVVCTPVVTSNSQASPGLCSASVHCWSAAGKWERWGVQLGAGKRRWGVRLGAGQEGELVEAGRR